MKRILLLGLLFATACTPPPEPPPTPPHEDGVLLTIILRPPTPQQGELTSTTWMTHFPPPGTAITSWNVAMGIGQIITLRVPTERLADVHRTLQAHAPHAEFFPSYDFAPTWTRHGGYLQRPAPTLTSPAFTP